MKYSWSKFGNISDLAFAYENAHDATQDTSEAMAELIDVYAAIKDKLEKTMPIKVSPKSMNGFAALGKAGVPDKDLAWLEEHGVDVQLTANAFKFEADWADEVELVPTALSELKALNAGVLTDKEFTDLNEELMITIQKLQGKIQETKVPGASTSAGALAMLAGKKPKSPESLQIKPALKEKAEQAAKVLPVDEPVAKPPKWSKFPHSLNAAPTVKLRDATYMYQPVKGSGSTSRYFMVAANDDIKVAARYKNDALSIRVEGPKWSNYTSKLKNVGFSKVVGEQGYASIHLTVSDEMLAAKALGAILVGLGIQFETEFPNLEVIKNKGA